MFCFISLLASVRLRMFVISLPIIHSCRLQLQKQCYVCKWCLLSYSAAVIRAAWFQLKITYFRSTNVIGYVYLRLRKHWLCVRTFLYNHVNNVQHWLIFLRTATTAPVFTLDQRGTFTSKTAHRQPRYHRLIQSHATNVIMKYEYVIYSLYGTTKTHVSLRTKPCSQVQGMHISAGHAF